MNFDYNAMRFFLELLLVLWSCVNSAWLYLANRQRATAEDLTAFKTAVQQIVKETQQEFQAAIKRVEDDLEGECQVLDDKREDLGRDVVRLQESMRHSVTQGDLDKIYQRINGMSNSVDKRLGEVGSSLSHLDGRFSGVEARINQVLGKLLEGAK